MDRQKIAFGTLQNVTDHKHRLKYLILRGGDGRERQEFHASLETFLLQTTTIWYWKGCRVIELLINKFRPQKKKTFQSWGTFSPSTGCFSCFLYISSFSPDHTNFPSITFCAYSQPCSNPFKTFQSHYQDEYSSSGPPYFLMVQVGRISQLASRLQL